MKDPQPHTCPAVTAPVVQGRCRTGAPFVLAQARASRHERGNQGDVRTASHLHPPPNCGGANGGAGRLT